MKNAILVSVITTTSLYNTTYYLDELEKLAQTLEINVVERASQKMEKINAKYYIGAGKVEEIKKLITVLNADTVIFDDELSPSQLRNLEEKLEITVIDCSLLILNIFEARANTTESILEIKLAKLKYMLPRLVGLNNSLSRQGGSATNSKGAGETQLELDRRRITNEIFALEKKLELARKNRTMERNKRNRLNIPIVSLVGYTNAGKSTTFNTLLNVCKKSDDKKVLEKDMLFATLNTSVRALKLPNNQQILLIDTVGFVSKLPTFLINSFRSTLEEIIYSSLIIHVVDISNKYYLKQIETTEQVLNELGVKNIKSLYLLNKTDKVRNPIIYLQDNYLLYSNNNPASIEKLVKYIEDSLLTNNNTLMDLEVPLINGKIISTIEAYGIIKAKVILPEKIYYKVYVPNNLIKDVLPFKMHLKNF